MPYFFDTNVIVGYLFYDTDNLGSRATVRIEDSEENHSGFTCKQECFGNNGHSGRATQIVSEISRELLEIKEMLQEHGLVNIRFQFDVRKFPRMGKIIKQHLDSGIFSNEDIFHNLDKLAQKFETEYYKRKRQILNPNICTWHPKRLNQYSIEGNILKNAITNQNDIQVLLDAYDVGKCIDNLILITNDFTDILKNKNLIIKTLPSLIDVIKP